MFCWAVCYFMFTLILDILPFTCYWIFPFQQNDYMHIWIYYWGKVEFYWFFFIILHFFFVMYERYFYFVAAQNVLFLTFTYNNFLLQLYFLCFLIYFQFRTIFFFIVTLSYHYVSGILTEIWSVFGWKKNLFILILDSHHTLSLITLRKLH